MVMRAANIQDMNCPRCQKELSSPIVQYYSCSQHCRPMGYRYYENSDKLDQTSSPICSAEPRTLHEVNTEERADVKMSHFKYIYYSRSWGSLEYYMQVGAYIYRKLIDVGNNDDLHVLLRAHLKHTLSSQHLD
ncbi:hypothetical protein RU639_004650 [Aspergillus parasiticus]